MTLKIDEWPLKTIEHLFYPSIIRQALCIISNPLVKSNLSYSLETLKSGKKWRFFFVPRDLENWRMTLKTIGHISFAASTFVHHLIANGEFKLGLQSGNAQFGSKSTIFFAVWPWNLTDDLEEQYGTSSRQHQALCTISSLYVNSNWSYGPKTAKWVMTSVTLTFDLWPWPFAWTSCLSMVITPENFRMMRWEEHCQKGVTDGQRDRQTDGQTEISLLRAAWSQLKYSKTLCIRVYNLSSAYSRHSFIHLYPTGNIYTFHSIDRTKFNLWLDNIYVST